MSRPLDPRLLRAAPTLRRLVLLLGTLEVVAGMLVVGQALVLADLVVAVFDAAVTLRTVLGRLVLLAGIGVGRAVLAGLREYAVQRASTRARAQLRELTLAAVVRLGPAWVRRQAPGRIVNATGPGLDALDGYVTRALPALVAAAVVPPIVLAALFVSDWQSGLILLVLLPLVPVFMALVGLTTSRLVQRQYAALERLSGQFLDLLRGVRTLRIYGQADAQARTLDRVTDEFRGRTVASLRIAFLSGLVLDLIAALSVAVVAVDVGLRLDSGDIGFATALAVLLLAPELFAPLRAMGAQHHASQDGTTAAAVVLDVVDEAAACDATQQSVQLTGSADGGLHVADLEVRYPDRAEPALSEVTLDVAAGAVVALTGPSGAGKSTLLGVLLGAVHGWSGSVERGLPDGHGDDGERWREDVAWLPQRPRPTQPTVGAEVRMGNSAAGDDDVLEACHLAAAPDPRTPLAEDGLGVSAGQRRRIALARVLLRVAEVERRGSVPLVLLDEPGEDLDRDTERVVAEVIAGLRGRATVLVATHSERLAELADVRVVVRAGRLAARYYQAPALPAAADRPLLAGTPLVPAGARPAEAAAVPPAEAAAVPLGYRLRELVRSARVTHRLALAALLSATAALAGLGLTATSMWLISRAAQHPNVQALAIAVVGVRTFALCRALLRYAERLVTHDAALRMLATLRGRVFAGLRTLSPAALAGYGRGDLLRRFVGDVDGAQEGLVRAAIPAVGACAAAVGSVVLATALAPAAGATLAAGLLAAGVLAPASVLGLRHSARELTRVAGARDRRAADLVEGLDELTAYGYDAPTLTTVAQLDAQFHRIACRPARAAALGTAATGFVSAVTLALVLAAAAATRGSTAAVDIGVLAVCALTGFDAVGALPGAFVAWARCRAGLQRVAEVTVRDAAPPSSALPTPAPGGPLGLRARDLGVAPAPGATEVLAGVELTVHPGDRIAIAGRSGSGKSTLLAAALRLLPVHGFLGVAGADREVELSRLSDAELAPSVAGSLQGDHVFDATLRDNLRVVRPAATDTDLDTVAARVGLLALIRSLPGGWSTSAGPDGAALSGGQRQRLLVARALLADPQILLLDEPTAHLDAETEALVLDDLLAATRGRTVVLTTHRSLAGREDAVDAYLRVQDGRLVGSSSDAVALQSA